MSRSIYCIDERDVIEQPYQTPDDMANKKGFVVKVQKIYKWKNLPVAKVLFFDCQQFSEKFREVLTAEETMRAFLSQARFTRVERILASEQVSQCAFFKFKMFCSCFCCCYCCLLMWKYLLLLRESLIE